MRSFVKTIIVVTPFNLRIINIELNTLGIYQWHTFNLLVVIFTWFDYLPGIRDFKKQMFLVGKIFVNEHIAY